MIRDAQPEGTFIEPGVAGHGAHDGERQSSRTTPVFTLGSQYDFVASALFVQASTMRDAESLPDQRQAEHVPHRGGSALQPRRRDREVALARGNRESQEGRANCAALFAFTTVEPSSWLGGSRDDLATHTGCLARPTAAASQPPW